MMSSRAGKAPAVRSYRRRKSALDLDLNLPAGEIREQEGAGVSREQEGPSIQLEPQEVQANQQQPAAQPTMIDVEAIDDDVIESSPRAFAEAKNNSRRNRRRTIVDVDLEEQIRVTNINNTKRRRQAPNQTLPGFDVFINLEASSCSMKQSSPKPPEPPKEPVFSCPICMAPLVEEMSTRCGHIFCKKCIKSAITVQAKCPTCRKKGVLLLNAVLTVRKHQANSHAKKGWEQFTDAVIKTISQKKEGVVFLLWGNSAKEKSRLIDATKHHILQAAHPSGLSANRGFFGCRHFSRTNQLLEQMGNGPIDWQLP